MFKLKLENIKVGDKLVLKKKDPTSGFKVGELVKVENPKSENMIFCKSIGNSENNGVTQWISLDCLKRYK